MASTAKVIKAVVKNNPKQYLRPKENWNFDEVSCLSQFVKMWNNTTIPNLLNNTTKINMI